uniref:Uncharacterized protein n=1 Tax=viral metagenome TaxID=1070528 RepID=A0A6H1ZC14_9ZZZZ
MPPVVAALGAIGSAAAPVVGAIGSGLGTVGGAIGSGLGTLAGGAMTGADLLGKALLGGSQYVANPLAVYEATGNLGKTVTTPGLLSQVGGAINSPVGQTLLKYGLGQQEKQSQQAEYNQQLQEAEKQSRIAQLIAPQRSSIADISAASQQYAPDISALAQALAPPQYTPPLQQFYPQSQQGGYYGY